MTELINQPTTNEMSNNDGQIEEFRIKMQNFTKLLNSKPKPEQVQKHQGYEYLPISHIEKELDKIYFGLIQYEVISYNQIFNEISCHARIKVFHPVINQWMQYDGLGSAVIQQDKDTPVADFHLYKKGNALQLSLPKAYAEAIKNAAKKIGKKFGSDLNRKFEDVYEPMIKTENKKKKVALVYGSLGWKQIVEKLSNNEITIADVEAKCDITEEQRVMLMDEAI
jgi:hypothetical protein